MYISLLARMDVSRFEDRRVHCRNSEIKPLCKYGFDPALKLFFQYVVNDNIAMHKIKPDVRVEVLDISVLIHAPILIYKINFVMSVGNHLKKKKKCVKGL